MISDFTNITKFIGGKDAFIIGLNASINDDSEDGLMMAPVAFLFKKEKLVRMTIGTDDDDVPWGYTAGTEYKIDFDMFCQILRVMGGTKLAFKILFEEKQGKEQDIRSGF